MPKNSLNTLKSPPRQARNEDVEEQLKSKLDTVRRRLQENRIWTRAIINSLGEGLIIVDEHGQITTANPYALRVFRCRYDELVGKWFPSVIVAVDQYGQPLDPFQRPSIRALSTGKSVSDYIYYVLPDDSLIPAFVTASPIMIGDKPAGALMVFRDLTEEKKLDIAKEEFISLASHQLRTPASGVKSILAMLANGDFGELSALQRKYLHRAIEANDRQLNIVEDMLQAAKIDAGKLEYEPAEADVARVVREVVDEHRVSTELRQQTVKLVSPKTCLMRVDAKKFRMVVDNLVGNASKYSKNGTTIEITLKTLNGEAILKVKDTGVGIPKEEVPKLFKKFSRIDNELSTLVGGSGLGLFLAKSIIEQHAGTITVKSEVGRGSTFIVRLPLEHEAPQ